MEISGLSAQEAARRLKEEGRNELPSGKSRTLLHILLELVREPMLLLLIACAVIYLFLGDLKEALLLAGSVGLIIGISVYQQGRTERALQALRDLSSPRALVIRDGKRTRIAARDLARGDLIVIVEGDRVPADARLLSCSHLSADESLLTGESAPVLKSEDLPLVFAGTLVTQGEGTAEVLATGPRTEMGKIGRSLQTIVREETRLQKEVRRIVLILAAVGLSICVLVAVLHGISTGNWLKGILAGLTLAISLVPEEFPVVLTVFLALGAWRISRRGVLTRRMAAIEMLGATTVLCADKTGTLTLNRMQVQELRDKNGSAAAVPAGETPVPEPFREMVSVAALASHPDAFDPMETALHALAKRTPDGGRETGTLVRRYPLSKERMAMSQVWQSAGKSTAAAKGAPEAIAELCRLSEPERRKMIESVHAMAEKGLRVLGVAQGPAAADRLPEKQEEFQLSFLGLIGLSDPIRPTAPTAIRECRQAGIRVVMITGDYPETARQIARQIGLEPVDQVLTGTDLNGLDDAAFQERVKAVNIYARIVPEQKLRLVNALKSAGEIVAMTGDGVNDAPALKAAHIGIAMGERGTDVAREAASLVLLSDDFSSMVRAIRLGRRIFDNLRKAMGYLFAIHVPIAGMALIPVLLRGPLVLLPMHIVFLELIIDPACSIVFEAEKAEKNIMERPPRDPKERLFNRRMVVTSLLQGAAALAAAAGIYLLGRAWGRTEPEIRTMTFFTMIVANLALILVNRSKAGLWLMMGGVLMLMAGMIYWPALQELFQFAPLRPADLGLAFAAGALGTFYPSLLMRRIISAKRP